MLHNNIFIIFYLLLIKIKTNSYEKITPIILYFPTNAVRLDAKFTCTR